MQFLTRPSVTEDLFPGSSVNLTDDPFFSFKPTVGSLLLFPRLVSLPFYPLCLGNEGLTARLIEWLNWGKRRLGRGGGGTLLNFWWWCMWNSKSWLYLRQKNIFHTRSQTWGPFLESPGNFSGPKSNIQIEIRLMSFVLLLVSLRHRLLSLENDDTIFLLEMYSWFCSFFNPYPFAIQICNYLYWYEHPTKI